LTGFAAGALPPDCAGADFAGVALTEVFAAGGAFVVVVLLAGAFAAVERADVFVDVASSAFLAVGEVRVAIRTPSSDCERPPGEAGRLERPRAVG
jgi:hypothetical protein